MLKYSLVFLCFRGLGAFLKKLALIQSSENICHQIIIKINLINYYAHLWFLIFSDYMY